MSQIFSRPGESAGDGSPASTGPRSVASRALAKKFRRELATHALPRPAGPAPVVSEQEVAALSEPVARYVRFMGAVGRPATWSVRARGTGGFRLKKDGPFVPCEVWQYDSGPATARVFLMRLRLGFVVPVTVRDTYVDGIGRMRGRAFDAVPVVDQSDEKIAIGELVTFLNDAILFAPSMLLRRPDVEWTAAGTEAFEVSIADHGRRVGARVTIDREGAPLAFETNDRFGEDPDLPGTMTRTRWTTPVDAWGRVEGRAFPKRAAATWHFPGGDFTYAGLSFDAGDIAFDVGPGDP